MSDFDRRKFLQLAAITAAGVAVSPGLGGGPSVDSSSLRVSTARESGEWTFERAQRLWQPMTRAIQHVGVPGYQWQAGVVWDGSRLFGPSAYRDSPALKKAYTALGPNLLNLSIVYGERRQFLERSGIGDPRVQCSLEEGRLPRAPPSAPHRNQGRRINLGRDGVCTSSGPQARRRHESLC